MLDTGDPMGQMAGYIDPREWEAQQQLARMQAGRDPRAGGSSAPTGSDPNSARARLERTQAGARQNTPRGRLTGNQLDFSTGASSDIPDYLPDLQQGLYDISRPLGEQAKFHSDDPNAQQKFSENYQQQVGDLYQRLAEQFPGLGADEFSGNLGGLNQLLEAENRGAQHKSWFQSFMPGLITVLQTLGPMAIAALGPLATGAGAGAGSGAAGVGSSTIGGLTVPGAAYSIPSVAGYSSAIPSTTLATAPLGGLAGGLAGPGLASVGNLSLPALSGISPDILAMMSANGILPGGSFGAGAGLGGGFSDWSGPSNVLQNAASTGINSLSRGGGGGGAGPAGFASQASPGGGLSQAQLAMLSAMNSQRHPGLAPPFEARAKGEKPSGGVAGPDWVQ